ncbi:glycosyltransferase [Selenomonas sp. KH1T6]|uniref:glycosyltransferase n=1 Tax=Selenomonas sp. KH1T6 TaxID=3158784 RepID=UPI0008A763A9|nr:Glycosyl transferase family 2 [Selenomonas ruminantium]
MEQNNREVMLSIIVPVYNCEDYLERCLDSILKIDVESYELILVDDGSQDSSPAICDEYAERYPQIKVIHQENQGPSAARNHGIDRAQGKYIAFVDSDDWIDGDLFTDFISYMEADENLDICISGTTKNFPDGHEEDYFPPRGGRLVHTEKFMTGKEALDMMLSKEDYFWFLWGRVYRRTLFQDDHLDVTVATSEDLDLNWKLFLRSRKIFYSDVCRYHYFMNENSLTENAKVVKRNNDDLKIYRRLLKQEDISPFCREMLEMRVLQRDYVNIRELMSEHGSKDVEIDEYYQELRETLSSFAPTTPYCRQLKEKLSALTGSQEECRELCWKPYAKLLAQVKGLTNEDRKVYLFGLGPISRVMGTFLLKAGSDFSGFVVSEASRRSKDEWLGKPVLVLEELEEKSAILLTLTEWGQRDIADLLDYKGFENHEYVDIAPAFTSGV